MGYAPRDASWGISLDTFRSTPWLFSAKSQEPVSQNRVFRTRTQCWISYLLDAHQHCNSVRVSPKSAGQEARSQHVMGEHKKEIGPEFVHNQAFNKPMHVPRNLRHHEGLDNGLFQSTVRIADPHRVDGTSLYRRPGLVENDVHTPDEEAYVYDEMPHVFAPLFYAVGILFG